LAQVIEAIDQGIQRDVYILALASQCRKVMGFPKRLIVPSKKGLEGFLRRLLAVEESVLDVRRIIRETALDAAEILPCFSEPGRSVLDENGIKRHTG
jgi:hypothetical protein